MLILEPINGLANRLRALDSAILLSRDSGIRLRIWWGLGNGINSRLQDLVALPDEIGKRVFSYTVTSRVSRFGKRLLLNTHRAIELRENIGAEQIISHATTRTAYIQACGRISSVDASYDWLRPTPEVARKIQSLVMREEIDRRIGVHIRRTDNVAARSVSTTEKFVQRMRHETDLDPEVRFFLCCDDPYETRVFQSTFGSRIFTRQDVELSRSARSGAMDALIDLLCLARTRKVIGSHWSSFSIEAAKIGRIPLVIVC
jgi:hypothetical protein